ncbi:MAG: hypothetical protein HWN66_05925 [Candidatus Helarchaeota archaeon]|nr:hypothetical protein [Candidatus Helarchaeota archaeon]
MQPIIISVQDAGKERGTRIYFSYKDLKKLKENLGENFFLFKNKKLLATIDPINETIIISSFGKLVTSHSKITLRNELDSIMKLNDNMGSNLDNHEDFKKKRLDFYIPIKGTGDNYWIAEICIKENLCYYCVATSQTELRKNVQEISDKHFPGLLELENTQINYFTSNLVYSPVPGYVAENAFKKITKKKIKDIEILPSISIPNDAELTPIIDMDMGKINGLSLKKRNLLAKYEIIAIATKASSVKNAMIKEIDDKILWYISTMEEDIFFDAITGEEINEIKLLEID